jgi:hypothetical protein
MKDAYIPKTLGEALKWLHKNLSDEDLSFIQKTKDEDTLVGKLHNSWGRAMRNNWGLWDDKSVLTIYFKKLGIDHADDMSGIIIRTFWRKLNNKPMELDEMIKYYQSYWKNMKDNGPVKIDVLLDKIKKENT